MYFSDFSVHPDPALPLNVFWLLSSQIYCQVGVIIPIATSPLPISTRIISLFAIVTITGMHICVITLY